MKRTVIAFLLSLAAALCLVSIAQADNETNSLPVFDAHIHYSYDVWDAISPSDAISRLRALGIQRAMVSSTDDEGTQRLYQADPDFVVPVLRPYRYLGRQQSWMYDETVIPYIKERLEKYRYAAIGEFHLEGKQAQTPVMREIVRLAKQYGLMLHVHSDARAIKCIFEQDPDARILWAHAGFEDHMEIRELLGEQANLWADLSFRYDIISEGTMMPPWKQLLVDYADRFLLGLDTYEPLRWLEISEAMQWQRELLAVFPDDVARKIAYENGERITGQFVGKP
jgi:hypothetical protein